MKSPCLDSYRQGTERKQTGGKPGEVNWSGRWDSNPRHSAWKADALPTELHPQETFSTVPYLLPGRKHLAQPGTQHGRCTGQQRQCADAAGVVFGGTLARVEQHSGTGSAGTIA